MQLEQPEKQPHEKSANDDESVPRHLSRLIINQERKVEFGGPKSPVCTVLEATIATLRAHSQTSNYCIDFFSLFFFLFDHKVGT